MKYKAIIFSFLVFIFLQGCGANKPDDITTLSNYRDYLKSIPNSDFYSITKSLKYYKDNFNTTVPEIKDSAFLDFRNLYYNVINSCSEVFWNNQPLVDKVASGKDDAEVSQFKKQVDENGLRLSITEGNYYIDEKPEYLLENFQGFVSTSVKEFLEIRMKELEEGFSEDAGLIIPLNKLGDRIILWENYINKYPGSLVLADAKFSYHLYLNTFVTGLDNTPISENQKLLPKFKTEYLNYINQHKGTESGRIVEGFYNLLAKNNFILTLEVDDFFKDNGIEPMRGIQPPTR